MAEFVSSFVTGFGEVIKRELPHYLNGAKVIDLYDGLIRYTYEGNPNNINNIVFFNNNYYVVRFFHGKELSFNRMVADIVSRKIRYLITNGTFRIRFSKSNQFVKVDKQIMLKAENTVCYSTKLKTDRLNPSTEMWYIIRDEGFGFYGQLLKKRTFTEKKLNKGELRPEFAYLMCCCGECKSNSVVMDPFAGYGAIPIQLRKHFSFSQILINDLDKSKISLLRRKITNTDTRIQFSCMDALAMREILADSVDIIITDPPWGYYEDIGDVLTFYIKMLTEFGRIINENGRIVLLSARKEEFVKAVSATNNFIIVDTLHTLVNGKKAAVFMLKLKDRM